MKDGSGRWFLVTVTFCRFLNYYLHWCLPGLVQAFLTVAFCITFLRFSGIFERSGLLPFGTFRKTGVQERTGGVAALLHRPVRRTCAVAGVVPHTLTVIAVAHSLLPIFGCTTTVYVVLYRPCHSRFYLLPFRGSRLDWIFTMDVLPPRSL
jgi:hypothetical protein